MEECYLHSSMGAFHILYCTNGTKWYQIPPSQHEILAIVKFTLTGKIIIVRLHVITFLADYELCFGFAFNSFMTEAVII